MDPRDAQRAPTARTSAARTGSPARTGRTERTSMEGCARAAPGPRMVGSWRVWDLDVDHPRALLDRGVALLEALAEDPTPGLRWYRSDRPALILGRGQAHVPLAPAPDVEIISRFSGGGAVLLDESLISLDVLLPAGNPLLKGDLAGVFDHVGEAWMQALSELGVGGLERHPGPGTARRRGTPREQLLAAVCYATVGRGEIMVGGRKLVGLAQRRRRAGALVQCGLLRRWEPTRLLEAFGVDPADVEIRAAAIGLDELLADPPDDRHVVQAVTDAFTV